MNSPSLSRRVFITTSSISTLIGVLWFAWDVRSYGTFWQGIPTLLVLSPFIVSIACLAGLFATLVWAAVECFVGQRQNEHAELYTERTWHVLIGAVIGAASATAALLVSPWISWIPYRYKSHPIIWVLVFLAVVSLVVVALQRKGGGTGAASQHPTTRSDGRDVDE